MTAATRGSAILLLAALGLAPAAWGKPPPRSEAPPPPPSAPEARAPARPAKDPWSAKFEPGRRARTAEAVSMKAFNGTVKLPAGTTVRLEKSKDIDGVESWEVRPLAGLLGQTGWLPRSSLTQQWPAGLADKVPPMLGDRSAEVDALLQLLRSSDFRTRIRAIGTLKASGITDERLFDTIAGMIAAGFAHAESSVEWEEIARGIEMSGDPGSRWQRSAWGKEVVWLTIALSYSGNAKYRPLLELAAEADRGKVSGHAEKSIENLEQYARWNHLINDPRNARPDRPAEVARAINMLQSGERELIAAAAPSISPDWSDVFDAIDGEVLKAYAKPLDGDAEDAVALLAKALGDSGNPGHRETLLTVARDARSRKLRSVAEDAAARALAAQARKPVAAAAPINPWEPRFEAGYRARAAERVEMRPAAADKGHVKALAAGESVALRSKRDVAGAEWWEVVQDRGINVTTGWLPRTSLTLVAPAGPADKPLPKMLGDRSAEIEKLLSQLKVSDFKVRVAAARALHLSGITDERVYDAVAKALASGLAQSDEAVGESSRALWAGIAAGIPGGPAQGSRIRPKTWEQEVAWLLKGLSFSGNARYRTVLEVAAETATPGSRDLSRLANAALEDLEQHALANQIINDPRNARPGRDDEVARSLNMVQSRDREMVREAVRRTRERGAQWAEVSDAMEAELLKMYTLDLDRDDEDVAAMLAKALYDNGSAKYQQTLATVARDTRSQKLRRYAKDGSLF